MGERGEAYLLHLIEREIKQREADYQRMEVELARLYRGRDHLKQVVQLFEHQAHQTRSAKVH